MLTTTAPVTLEDATVLSEGDTATLIEALHIAHAQAADRIDAASDPTSEVVEHMRAHAFAELGATLMGRTVVVGEPVIDLT